MLWVVTSFRLFDINVNARRVRIQHQCPCNLSLPSLDWYTRWYCFLGVFVKGLACHWNGPLIRNNLGLEWGGMRYEMGLALGWTLRLPLSLIYYSGHSAALTLTLWWWGSTPKRGARYSIQIIKSVTVWKNKPYTPFSKWDVFKKARVNQAHN